MMHGPINIRLHVAHVKFNVVWDPIKLITVLKFFKVMFILPAIK